MTKDILREIAIEYGTPTYVFDTDKLTHRVGEIKKIVGKKVQLCYAVKANPFLAVAMSEVVSRLEVCSPGELSICQRLGIDMDKVVLSGVNKTKKDVWQGVQNQVGTYTAESIKHLDMINEAAIEQNKTFSVLLRLTSGNQFGMDERAIKNIVKNKEGYKGVKLVGLHYFSGTQKKKTGEIEKELTYLDNFCDSLRDKMEFSVEKLEYGPGFSVPYFENDDFSDTLAPIKELAPRLAELGAKYDFTIEMGRFFAAECGIYLSRVEDIKENDGINYCIIDGGINHISYYGQTLAMKIPKIQQLKPPSNGGKKDYTICGSLCTTADVIVRKFPFASLEMGDIIAFYNMGAYSVTEGIYLFLSRKMPRVVLYCEKTGGVLVRDYIETHTFNSL
ncbi:MAG: alanine racemase [Oscillospiraceae bacterium]